MLNLSSRRLILYLLISLVLGIASMQLISSNQLKNLNAELYQQQLQMTEINTQFDSKVAQLQAENTTDEANFVTLLAERNNVTEKLAALQMDYADLEKQYSSVVINLNEATGNIDGDGVHLGDISSDQQMEKFNEEKEKLNESILALQVENSTLIAASRQAQYVNETTTQLMGETQNELDSLKVQLAQLSREQAPSPNHAMASSEVWNRPQFRSVEWIGRDFELQKMVQEIGLTYNKTHTYILNETDCNDMAVDLWNMLFTQNIKAVIVVGNLDKTGEAFDDLSHAWLYVFNSLGKVIYLEATSGEVFYGRLPNGSANTQVLPYREGFIYQKPSDLWKDLKRIW